MSGCKQNDDVPNEDNAVYKQNLKKIAQAWQHFSIESSEDQISKYVHCDHCAKSFEIGFGWNMNTDDLIQHMRSKHPNLMSVGQVELEEIPGLESYQTPHFESIITWIIMANKPINMYEQPAFIELMQTLNPNVKMVTAQIVKQAIIAKWTELNASEQQ